MNAQHTSRSSGTRSDAERPGPQAAAVDTLTGRLGAVGAVDGVRYPKSPNFTFCFCVCADPPHLEIPQSSSAA